MDREELINCIKLLRERRESLPALRDYRPQRKGSTTSTPAQLVDLGSTFGNLFARAEAEPSEAPEEPTGEVQP